MRKKIYITTPIYYANDVPHIGHAYTTVAADVLARWHRLAGNKTFFLTGADEHGAKIEEKARELKTEPQKHVDEMAGKFKAVWREFNISNDNFLRTTDEKHKKAVQKALRFMRGKGDIYLSKYDGLYCRGCEQYKSEHDLEDGLCPDHRTIPEKMSEECYTFRLSKYQDELLEKIKKNELRILPENRKNEIVSFYEKQGLEDVSFSRKNIHWGIPVPWDESHTVYVWADAFLNYLTGLGWDGSAGKRPKMWPAQVQFMSKDILRVHATIWPAMLLSLDLDLPKAIFAHGYFLVDGQKMSKSIGNVILPSDLAKKYGVDAARYLIMSAAVFGNDGDIGLEKFDEKYNSDLANGLGNLIARVSNLLEKNRLEVKLKTNSDKKLLEFCGRRMENFQFDAALKIMLDVLRECDEELSAAKPWKMTGAQAVKKVLEPVAQKILNVAALLKPFMPTVSEKIIKQFTAKKITKDEALFPRI